MISSCNLLPSVCLSVCLSVLSSRFPSGSDGAVTSPTSDRAAVAKKRFTLQGFSNLKAQKGNSEPSVFLTITLKRNTLSFQEQHSFSVSNETSFDFIFFFIQLIRNCSSVSDRKKSPKNCFCPQSPQLLMTEVLHFPWPSSHQQVSQSSRSQSFFHNWHSENLWMFLSAVSFVNKPCGVAPQWSPAS